MDVAIYHSISVLLPSFSLPSPPSLYVSPSHSPSLHPFLFAYLRSYPSMHGIGGSIFSPGPQLRSSLAYIGSRLYVFGGQGLFHVLSFLSPSPPPLFIFHFSFCFLLTIYAEYDSNRKYTNDVWEFDLEDTKKWYWIAGDGLVPDLYAPVKFNATTPRGRGGFAYVAVDDGMWIYGGLGLIAPLAVEGYLSLPLFSSPSHSFRPSSFLSLFLPPSPPPPAPPLPLPLPPYPLLL